MLDFLDFLAFLLLDFFAVFAFAGLAGSADFATDWNGTTIWPSPSRTNEPEFCADTTDGAAANSSPALSNNKLFRIVPPVMKSRTHPAGPTMQKSYWDTSAPDGDFTATGQPNTRKCRIGRPGVSASAAATMAAVSMP